MLISAWGHVGELRSRIVSTNTLQIINNKIKTPSSRSPIDTTHLVGFRSMADNINSLVCLSLPRDSEDPDPIISTAVDHINGHEYDGIDND
ncbi:14182_t:CDS:2, partial [Gigaspora rosea]